MVSTEEGKDIECSGTIKAELDTGYAGFDIVHDLTSMARIFRGKQPSVHLGPTTYHIVDDRDKELPGTILMMGVCVPACLCVGVCVAEHGCLPVGGCGYA